MIRIIMQLEHPYTKHKLTVDYDETSYTHDLFDNDGYLGRVRMRELFFAGYKCVCKDISIQE